MNTKLDQFMFQSVYRSKKGGYEVKMVEVLFALCMLAITIIIRGVLFDIAAGDHVNYFEDWMTQISDNGGFASLSKEIGNYTTPYNLLMCLASYIPIDFLYSLKLVSVPFDYLGMVAVFLIVIKLTKNFRVSMLGSIAFLLLPTVAFNAAVWSQCDMMNVSFMLFALYYLMCEKDTKAMVFFSIAFCFKFQTVFLLPAMLIVWLMRGYKWRKFLLLPIIYIISMVPALLAGRSFMSLLTLYAGQTEQFPNLVLNFPNVYIYFNEQNQASYTKAGIVFTIALLGIVLFALYANKVKLTMRSILTLTLLTAGLTVFFLPRMHDRYGLFVDAVAFLYAFANPKRIWVAAGFCVYAFFAYMPFLSGVYPGVWNWLPVFMFVLLGVVAFDLYKQSVAPVKEES